MLALTTADWRADTGAAAGSTARGFVALKSFADRYQR
jgi:hypothetical protein